MSLNVSGARNSNPEACPFLENFLCCPLAPVPSLLVSCHGVESFFSDDCKASGEHKLISPLLLLGHYKQQFILCVPINPSASTEKSWFCYLQQITVPLAFRVLVRLDCYSLSNWLNNRWNSMWGRTGFRFLLIETMFKFHEQQKETVCIYCNT